MYYKVPFEMQPSLLRELKRLRFRNAVVYFPILLLIFSAAALWVLLLKFHFLIDGLHDELSHRVSETAFWLIVGGGVVICVAIVLFLILRQMQRETSVNELPFCPACDAVDSDETGRCPICGATPSQQAIFVFAPNSGEDKLMRRFGLAPARHKSA